MGNTTNTHTLTNLNNDNPYESFIHIMEYYELGDIYTHMCIIFRSFFRKEPNRRIKMIDLRKINVCKFNSEFNIKEDIDLILENIDVCKLN